MSMSLKILKTSKPGPPNPLLLRAAQRQVVRGSDTLQLQNVGLSQNDVVQPQFKGCV